MHRCLFRVELFPLAFVDSLDYSVVISGSETDRPKLIPCFGEAEGVRLVFGKVYARYCDVRELRIY